AKPVAGERPPAARAETRPRGRGRSAVRAGHGSDPFGRHRWGGPARQPGPSTRTVGTALASDAVARGAVLGITAHVASPPEDLPGTWSSPARHSPANRDAV